MFNALHNSIVTEIQNCKQQMQADRETRFKRLTDSYQQLYVETASVINEAESAIACLERQLDFMRIKLEVIQQHVSNAIITETDECKWIGINKTSCDILGIDSELCIGKNTNEIMELYPKLQEFFIELIKLEEDCLQQCKCISRKIKVNTNVVLLIKITPISDNDKTYKELIIVGTII